MLNAGNYLERDFPRLHEQIVINQFRRPQETAHGFDRLFFPIDRGRGVEGIDRLTFYVVFSVLEFRLEGVWVSVLYSTAFARAAPLSVPEGIQSLVSQLATSKVFSPPFQHFFDIYRVVFLDSISNSLLPLLFFP